MHAAGNLYNTDGSLNNRGVGAYYWSSTQWTADNSYGWTLQSGNGAMDTFPHEKAWGFSVRCIKD